MSDMERKVKNYVKKKSNQKLRISLFEKLKEIRRDKGESHLSNYISASDIFNNKRRVLKRQKSAENTQKLFVNNKNEDHNIAEKIEFTSYFEKMKEDGSLTEPLDLDKFIENSSDSKNTTSRPKLPKFAEVEPKVSEIVKNKLKPIIVERSDEIISLRSKLPIMNQEFDILQDVRDNACTVVSGSTGSGKTTQIPQFLYEAGYSEFGMIGITQPRRVAATTLCSRVAYEMGDHGRKVGYQIRYDSKIDNETKIKFMTDGILIQEMKNDFMLRKYSVIIIDEAHERSVYTDILVSLLTRVVAKRAKESSPLKLIIMSATLFLDEFVDNEKLFAEKPAVISIESRLHKTTIHYTKSTPDNHLECAAKKVLKIHNNMPHGSILVFLIDKKEIKDFVDNLSAKNIPELLVLPLYSLLDPEKQAKVFFNYEKNQRVVIAATNIAETSITIPNIKYVVDCGKAKNKIFNRTTGASAYQVTWISKASAIQRAGRAGRMSDGHVYRLYSLALFGTMAEFTMPEILKVPLEQIVLQLKCIGVHKIKNFPFITPPRFDAIDSAERILMSLGFLQLKLDTKTKLEVFIATTDGRLISELPIIPKFSRVILTTIQRFKPNILQYILMIVSCLSVTEYFTSEEARTNFYEKYIHSDPNYLILGDIFVYLKIFGILSFDISFVEKSNLRKNVPKEIFKQYSQLIDLVNQIWPEICLKDNLKIEPPSRTELNNILKCLISASVDTTAASIKAINRHKVISNDQMQINRTKGMNKFYQPITCVENDSDSQNQFFLIHSKSIIAKLRPQFLIYQSSMLINGSNYLIDCTPVTPELLADSLPQFVNHDPANSNSSTASLESQMANDLSIESFYHNGRVTALKCVSFGPLKWPIGEVNVVLGDGFCSILRFAMHLLQLDVFSIPNCEREELIKNRMYPLDCLRVKLYQKYPYSLQMINKMIENDVFNKTSLEKALESDKFFLYHEFVSWFDPEIHEKIFENWNNIQLL
ncbi:MAG: ATP-dependent RNA helicase dhx37 [Marteilia pararefringens]